MISITSWKMRTIIVCSYQMKRSEMCPNTCWGIRPLPRTGLLPHCWLYCFWSRWHVYRSNNMKLLMAVLLTVLPYMCSFCVYWPIIFYLHMNRSPGDTHTHALTIKCIHICTASSHTTSLCQKTIHASVRLLQLAAGQVCACVVFVHVCVCVCVCEHWDLAWQM